MNQQLSKYKLLVLGLLIDAVGVVTSSWVLPGIGDFADIAWAPISAWLMTKMYKGTAGKVAGVITFVEELIPFVDIVPSFTLMWLYTFVFKDSKVGEKLENRLQ
ncbi:hypothetical protein [Dokdonia sp. Hel_I_53]|uniref:hypothetical protein n=1 Tax=Dokdonia sp. Hel_I_53 TaxID=1566287 RepID=UPI001199382E|nr:hypothetical protein [Dokdonia sp. Hel_I_53]TVZ51464.1 hypothetical protein OD90_0607 [Dokdonia sp. Hel_I_53]